MTVDEYLEATPEPQRSTLLELRRTLRDLLPEATEEISYGVPAFKVGGKAIAGYASYKNHCSYFPHSGRVLSELAGELSQYDWDKGTLRFPTDEPLPPALVGRLVQVRLAHLDLA